MPEGDSIFRAARTLHRALGSKVVVRFESVFPALIRVHDDRPITGMAVDRVESAGKHVLMHFRSNDPAAEDSAANEGLVLHTHMRMNGSWHIYRPGERWRRPHRDMRIVVATSDFEAVGFNIPVAEFVRSSRLPRHSELSSLGPDLLGKDFDTAAAVARIRTQPMTEIADALLNQRLVAGIGNVYKSEVLFACGVNPFALVEQVGDTQLAQLVETARRFLQLNVSTGLAPMTTYTGYRRTAGRGDASERLWVYGRGRLPCRRCGTAVSVQAQGKDARLTYWCSRCQQVPAEIAER
jgi:endonuclease VIII